MKKLLVLSLLVLSLCAQAQETIQLPQPDRKMLSMSLGDALQQRRSVREYQKGQEIDRQTLSTLLWAACGISEPSTGKITAPSAVNMQDIKVYVCSEKGAYLFNPKANTLTRVCEKDLRPAIAGRQAFAREAPLSLVLVSTKDTDRSPNEKYGGVDAGYVSQNIYLACTALGLKTVARASMNFDVLKEELKLKETSLLELNHPIGK